MAFRLFRKRQLEPAVPAVEPLPVGPTIVADASDSDSAKEILELLELELGAMIRQLERAANSVAGDAEATAATLSTIRQRTNALTGRTNAAQGTATWSYAWTPGASRPGRSSRRSARPRAGRSSRRAERLPCELRHSLDRAHVIRESVGPQRLGTVADGVVTNSRRLLSSPNPGANKQAFLDSKPCRRSVLFC